ncbi:MAG TPA: hypothetical protein VLH77_00045 [Gammaproteobacteria bacterium]|nr:hypothetical protein [Gammaproteobacteria bacterium]
MKKKRINAIQKGKRVERVLVNWLKERGILSARRTQQYSGNNDGPSDVIAPDELPSFHIECKATASKKLTLSLLKKWYAQLERDCPADKVAVLFHFANGIRPFVMVPFLAFKKIEHNALLSQVYITGGESFNPATYFIDDRAAGFRVVPVLHYVYNNFRAVVFEINRDKYFLTFEAPDILETMLDFEKFNRKTSQLPQSVSLPVAQ